MNDTSPKNTPLGDSSIGCIGHGAQRRCEDDERCDVQEMHGSKRMMVIPSSGCLINVEIRIEARFLPHSGVPKESRAAPFLTVGLTIADVSQRFDDPPVLEFPKTLRAFQSRRDIGICVSGNTSTLKVRSPCPPSERTYWTPPFHAGVGGNPRAGCQTATSPTKEVQCPC